MSPILSIDNQSCDLDAFQSLPKALRVGASWPSALPNRGSRRNKVSGGRYTDLSIDGSGSQGTRIRFMQRDVDSWQKPRGGG